MALENQQNLVRPSRPSFQNLEKQEPKRRGNSIPGPQRPAPGFW